VDHNPTLRVKCTILSHKQNSQLFTTSTTPPMSLTSPPPGVGSLKLIIGPMFSGKSTELLHHINSYRSIGTNVLVINHAFNKRYDSAGVSTHDNLKEEDCVVVLNLMDIVNDHTYAKKLEQADVVCIEELQFFEDALDAILILVNKRHKKVIAAGLIADYTCQPFGDVCKLIPHSDDIQHVKALCAKCNDGTVALFTQRVSPHKDQVAVGAKSMYQAVCRKHFTECVSCETQEEDYQVGYSYAEYEW